MRENKYREALVEHLECREWVETDIQRILRFVGHTAVMSEETVLGLFLRQQAVAERIQAEKDHDRVFTPDYSEPSLFDSQPYLLADREGEALPPRLEGTDTLQNSFDRTWHYWE